jgi:alkaline phosphatase D
VKKTQPIKSKFVGMNNLSFKRISIPFSCLLFIAGCTSENPTTTELTGAPMLGHVGMRHAVLWSQTTDASDMKLSYWERDTSIAGARSTDGIRDAHNCSVFEISGLEPNVQYEACIETLDGRVVSDTLHWTTQELWQYRKDPPAFTFATGSCAFINEEQYDRPGTPYGGDYQTFKSIARESFQGMLWLGDNVYLREVDVTSKAGYIYRYEQMRQLPELQSLLSKGSHYAIWDDHDFGPDNSDGSWYHADWAKESFDSFWVNPGNGLREAPELNVAYFQYADVDFFLLDNRTHRVNHTMGSEKRRLLGEVQMNWLLNALKNSRAPFKMVAVGGQMLSDVAKYENFAQYPEEREELLDALNELNIKGVVFLSGDRHSTELSQIQLPNGRFVYDLTVSPLTSSSYDNSEEPNSKRVEGTMVGDRNYALLDFSGPRKERVLKMSVKNSEGELLWEKSIEAANGYELK